jgi:SAM-dependent methyltransferase
VEHPHEVNKRWWNEVTPVHTKSDFYDVDGFVAGRNTLGAVERSAIGDVAGKRLLHLQCHFGMDTLSWARMGADVTGVDFSSEAVAQASALAKRVGLDDQARFIEADVTQVGKVGDGGFDIIFTSFGTIVWLESLDAWAETIAANLAKNGFFYFLDSHPTAMLFDEESSDFVVRYDYFHNEEPLLDPSGGADYADEGYRIESESRQFSWPLQDIFGALQRRGLVVCDVREYPFCAWRFFPDMEKREDGYWYRTNDAKSIPILLGFKAHW